MFMDPLLWIGFSSHDLSFYPAKRAEIGSKNSPFECH